MAKTKTMGLSAFLREARIEAGLTQLEAARELGHSTSQYISNFERGLCEPSLEIAVKLCDLYKINKRELYDMMVSIYEGHLRKKIFTSTAGKKKA